MKSGIAGSIIPDSQISMPMNALKNINESQQQAYNFLKDADWLIITLGSSFSYRLTD